MSETWILALRVSLDGCAGALISTTRGSCVQAAWRAHPEPRREEGFWTLEPAAILTAFTEVCRELAAHPEASERLMAMGMCTPTSTIQLLGSENRPLSRVLFGAGIPVPRQHVHKVFEDDPELVRVFRGSPIRQLEQARPGLSLNVSRVVSLGALLTHEMTRAWIECAACPPTGMPYDLQRGQARADEVLWRAAGISWTVSPLLVPPGGIIGQLAPLFARSVGLPEHLPIIATGDDVGVAARALRAHDRRWLLWLDEDLRVAWTGLTPPPPTPAPMSGMSLQIAPATYSERIPQAFRQLREHIEWYLGPGSGQATFCGVLARTGARRRALAQPPEGSPALAPDPLGLRVLPGHEALSLIGLRAGHHDGHFKRALIEGLGFEARRWAHEAFGAEPAEPPVLWIGEGWPEGTGETLANALAIPVRASIGADAGRTLLLEIAAIIAEDLDLPRASSWTYPAPVLYTPEGSATRYEALFELHCALVGMAGPLLS